MMKLRLDLDALVVDSFRSTPETVLAVGTVLGLDAKMAAAQAGGLSDGDTWCMDNGCTGDEQCTASTWTEEHICRTDRGCGTAVTVVDDGNVIGIAVGVAHVR